MKKVNWKNDLRCPTKPGKVFVKGVGEVLIFQRDIDRSFEMMEKTGEFPEAEIVLDEVKGVGLISVTCRWIQAMSPGRK